MKNVNLRYLIITSIPTSKEILRKGILVEHNAIYVKGDEEMSKKIIVNVRWHDSYLETFEAKEVRFGSDLLWIRLLEGSNRHIPLRSVRWFSVNPESHENISDATQEG